MSLLNEMFHHSTIDKNAFRRAMQSARKYRPKIASVSPTFSRLALLLVFLLLFSTATTAPGRFTTTHHPHHPLHPGNLGHLRHSRHTLHALHLRHGILERIIANATATVRWGVYREDLADFPASGGSGGGGEFFGGREASDSQAVGGLFSRWVCFEILRDEDVEVMFCENDMSAITAISTRDPS